MQHDLSGALFVNFEGFERWQFTKKRERRAEKLPKN